MLAAKGSSSTTASDCNGDGEPALLKAAAQTRHHSGCSAGPFRVSQPVSPQEITQSRHKNCRAISEMDVDDVGDVLGAAELHTAHS